MRIFTWFVIVLIGFIGATPSYAVETVDSLLGEGGRIVATSGESDGHIVVTIQNGKAAHFCFYKRTVQTIVFEKCTRLTN